MGARIMDCAWAEAMCRLNIHPSDIEYKALPNDVYKAIPTGWPPDSEIYADIPSWSAVNTGNIFESYATCGFLKANKETRSALKSIRWAAILAEPRAARALARYCRARGREKDIPSDILEEKEAPYINLGDQPFPPSDEEEEDPHQGKREVKAMATAAAGAAIAAVGAAKAAPKKAPLAPPAIQGAHPKKPLPPVPTRADTQIPQARKEDEHPNSDAQWGTRSCPHRDVRYAPNRQGEGQWPQASEE